MARFTWKSRYNVLAVLFLTWAVAVVDRMAMPVALPYISKEMNLGPFETSLILSTFFTGYAISHIPGGLLADKFGVRKVATISLLCWSAFTALTGMANNLVQLLITRLTFGLGEGAFPAASLKTVATWFPRKERATATAVMFTANSVGAAISPLIVVAIMSVWGWRGVFHFLFIPGLVVAGLFWLIVKDRPADARGITAEELEEIADEGEDQPGAHEKGSMRDLLQPTILKYFFAYMTFDIAYWGFQSWLPTYLVGQRGFSMAEMGAAASLPFVAGAFGRLAGGWLSDTVFKDKRRYLVAGTQILSALCLYLMFITTSTWTLIIAQTIAGLFLNVFHAAFWGLPMSTISREKMGVATGFINMGAQIGGLISPLAIGALLQFSGGSFAAAGLFLEACIFVSLLIVLSFGVQLRTANND